MTYFLPPSLYDLDDVNFSTKINGNFVLLKFTKNFLIDIVNICGLKMERINNEQKKIVEKYYLMNVLSKIIFFINVYTYSFCTFSFTEVCMIRSGIQFLIDYWKIPSSHWWWFEN